MPYLIIIFIILLVLRIKFNPKFDVTEENQLILWYNISDKTTGHNKRAYFILIDKKE